MQTEQYLNEAANDSGTPVFRNLIASLGMHRGRDNDTYWK
jgi:hypothetical protein